MIIIEKLTGHYVETLLSTPTPPLSPEAKKQNQIDASISVVGYAGTCDAMPVGDPRPTAGVPGASHNADAVVEEDKPQKNSDTRETHLHAHRHHRHGQRHKPLTRSRR